MSGMLDHYYILCYNRFPQKSWRLCTRVWRIPPHHVSLVVSSDCPVLQELEENIDTYGYRLLVFNRADYIHDPYLSLMDKETVLKHFPTTATPARRFISHHEYTTKPAGRVYAVLDDDVTSRLSNPFRKLVSDDPVWDYTIWDRARAVLENPKIWACCFVNPYTWSGHLNEGLEAQQHDRSLFHRKGQLANQSIWIISNKECHTWYSPIAEDYITTARYAAQGRFAYCLHEYVGMDYPNTNGAIWSQHDPTDRTNKAGAVAGLRIFGAQYTKYSNKPYKKYCRYTFPHIVEES